ncbi:MAG: CCE_0567 family metalloprotein [Elainellaceae cyanobacterium]
MNQTTTLPLTIDELKTKIRKLNSKAGQMKMDLHDIAEGLPNDLEKLPDAAAKTYDLFCQLQALRQQLRVLENS